MDRPWPSGIWATAPYLHNGSVPNLTELLKPAKREGLNEGEYRKERFHVGSTRYDTKNVGFVEDAASPVFDTTIDGNKNTGHEFGVDLTAQQKLDLIEYLKSL